MTTTTAKKLTATEKRYAAISALCETTRTATIGEAGPTVTWHRDHADRATLAADIRALTTLGRTERWTAAVEGWALEVEGSTEETYRWAFDQFGIWASYAAE